MRRGRAMFGTGRNRRLEAFGGASAHLQGCNSGHGIPAPPQVQACSPSHGLSGWLSHTHPQSSQTASVERSCDSQIDSSAWRGLGSRLKQPVEPGVLYASYTRFLGGERRCAPGTAAARRVILSSLKTSPASGARKPKTPSNGTAALTTRTTSMSSKLKLPWAGSPNSYRTGRSKTVKT